MPNHGFHLDGLFDSADQAGEDVARADFQGAVHAGGGEEADGFDPSDR
jgi:hypothetical protein